MDDITITEEERMANLQEARLESTNQTQTENTDKPKLLDAPLSFGKKVSQHWLILVVAVFFDLLGIIPVIGVAFNAIFGAILWLYFGSKKKKGGSELLKIALPIGLGSIIDFFIGILPVNIGAALIRIALN